MYILPLTVLFCFYLTILWFRRAMGLHVAIRIDHCHEAELTTDESWYKTVVLAKGTKCLPGIASVLYRDHVSLCFVVCSSVHFFFLFYLYIEIKVRHLYLFVK